MMCVEITRRCLHAAWGSPRPAGGAVARVQAAMTAAAGAVPWVAISGSQLRPVVMTAYRCRKMVAAMAA